MIGNNSFAPIACLMRTDAYKLGHVQQYQLSGNISRVYSNYTNRKSRVKGIGQVVHFGLQAYIQKYLMDDFALFFSSDVDVVCSLYEQRLASILGPNTIGSEHVRKLWETGYLPLRFCAAPEGTQLPIGVPAFTVENTDPDFYWLTNYIETGLSAGVWQASTSATIAHRYREILDLAAFDTGGPAAFVDWQAHDFSYRGMSSHESAAVSGAAHLLSFTGTDSLVALDWIDRYYGGSYVAGSVPATEHSVMCTGIETIGEEATFSKLLDLYPTGIVSVVSDTFDLWKVLTEYLPTLRAKIMSRDGKLVIRPDSGDPVNILCGDPAAPAGSPEAAGVVNILYQLFGGGLNERGFKELDPHVGVIYGDSITLERAVQIINRLGKMGYASTNVVFGIGSYTYQMNTRDTFGSAIKATWAEVDGKGYDLWKDPITDDGTKKSARGRLTVLYSDVLKGLVLGQRATPEMEAESLLQPIWENGGWVKTQTFDEVRTVLNGARASVS